VTQHEQRRPVIAGADGNSHDAKAGSEMSLVRYRHQIACVQGYSARMVKDAHLAQAQVEEQKRRAEADKLAAITALEQRSRDFMAEKEANRRLEQKIASMQSQLLTGGAALTDTPAFRCLFFLSSPRCLFFLSSPRCRHAQMSAPQGVRSPVPSRARVRICKARCSQWCHFKAVLCLH